MGLVARDREPSGSAGRRRCHQRHGDLIWQVRFHDGWLYLLLLLEFQSTIDPAMAVRVLTYTSLLYEKLIDDGVLREHGKLPPVLPIVICYGGKRWTAAEDVAAMIAGGGEALAPYQPSLRYYLLDEGRAGEADLPGRNLMSALVALETNREREQAPVLLCSRRRWHARLTIASVRSRQQPPKCVKIRCLYRRTMQLLEALHVAADGLQVGG